MRLAASEGVWAGGRNPKAKLTDGEAARILALRRLGASVKAISEAYDIPPRSVYYMLKEGWNHVSQEQIDTAEASLVKQMNELLSVENDDA